MTNQKEKRKKSVFVVGDSMVKYVNGWEMCKNKVPDKTLSGAKTRCTNDYVEPSIRSSADHFILHVGTMTCRRINHQMK